VNELVAHDDSVASAIEKCAKICLSAKERCRDGSDTDWQEGYNAACDELAFAIRMAAQEFRQGKPGHSG
jgi:hypothetical protein